MNREQIEILTRIYDNLEDRTLDYVQHEIEIPEDASEQVPVPPDWESIVQVITYG